MPGVLSLLLARIEQSFAFLGHVKGQVRRTKRNNDDSGTARVQEPFEEKLVLSAGNSSDVKVSRILDCRKTASGCKVNSRWRLTGG